MRPVLKTLCVVGLAHSLIACAASSDSYYSSNKSPENKMETPLTDANGMSLYTFDKDTAEISNCNGACATLWPPLLAKDGEQKPKSYTRITRNDGSLQWAFNGQPLYTWVRDTKPGDTTGDGVKGVWHLAKKP